MTALRSSTDSAVGRVAPGGAECACPACGAFDVEAWERWALREQHLAYGNGNASVARALDQHHGHPIDTYRMLRCRGCRLEFADPPLAPSVEWYSTLYTHLDLYPTQRWEYEVVTDAMAPNDSVVDYGCGSGNFLVSLQGKVRRTCGFDFSSEGVEPARRQGLDVRLLDLDGGVQAMGLPVVADHVTAFHVLEHLTQPRALFRFAARVAGPSARLWVAVPSDRRASRIYGEPDAFDAPPHHLTRWSESALRELGLRCGWTLVRHAYEPLSETLQVWEATRRSLLYGRFDPPGRSLQWLYRRTLAAGVWAGRKHRRMNASGFSMLACFARVGGP